MPAFRLAASGGVALALLALASLPPPPAFAWIGPRYGGELVRGHLGEIATVDPARAVTEVEREAARQVHAGLYRFDAEGEPIPDLVERVEVEAGGERVRLSLLRAWFHDGRELTARDVKASIERFAAGGGAGALLAAPALVTVVSDRALILDVERAPVLWPWLLADLRAAVLPAELGDGRVGAGPFAVRTFDREQRRLELSAYPRHHRGRPLLDRVEYRGFPDERALVLAHRYRGVGLIDLTGAEEGPSQPAAAVDEAVVLLFGGGLAPAAREAVKRSLRPEALVNVVLGGRATRMEGLLPLRPVVRDAGAVSASAAAPGTSPESRRSLSLLYLAESGLRNVAERLRVDLHSAGFGAVLSAVGRDELAQALSSRRFDLLLATLPVNGRPAVLDLAAAAAAMATPLPEPLRSAAAGLGPGGALGSELFAAEAELLAGDIAPLYRRRHLVYASPELRDLSVAPDGVAVLEDAWRWPPR